MSRPLRRSAVVGATGFALSVLLLVAAFLTNEAPLPYFAWMELPVQLPIEQPRLYRYPVSMTVSLWLWHATAPFVFLWVYERRGQVSRWLIGAPLTYMTTFFVYCFWLWPNAGDTWALEPATSWPCYAYCYVGGSTWATVTAAAITMGVLAWLATVLRLRIRPWLTACFGIVSVPLGIPMLYAASLQLKYQI